jgi:hypothetical protein
MRVRTRLPISPRRCTQRWVKRVRKRAIVRMNKAGEAIYKIILNSFTW